MKPYICEDCGAVFDGGIRSQFCPACKVKRRNEASAKYNLKRKEETAKRRAEREAAKAAGKTVDEKPKVDPDNWLTHPDQKQCVGCKYRAAFHSQSSADYYCDYMDRHAKEMARLADKQGLPWDGIRERRKHDGLVCLVREEE